MLNVIWDEIFQIEKQLVCAKRGQDITDAFRNLRICTRRDVNRTPPYRYLNETLIKPLF